MWTHGGIGRGRLDSGTDATDPMLFRDAAVLWPHGVLRRLPSSHPGGYLERRRLGAPQAAALPSPCCRTPPRVRNPSCGRSDAGCPTAGPSEAGAGPFSAHRSRRGCFGAPRGSPCARRSRTVVVGPEEVRRASSPPLPLAGPADIRSLRRRVRSRGRKVVTGSRVRSGRFGRFEGRRGDGKVSCQVPRSCRPCNEVTRVRSAAPAASA
jgi:hypothetical protein